MKNIFFILFLLLFKQYIVLAQDVRNNQDSFRVVKAFARGLQDKDSVSPQELFEARRLVCSDTNYRVVSFIHSFNNCSGIIERKVETGILSRDDLKMFKYVRPGQPLFFEKILVENADGKRFYTNPVYYIMKRRKDEQVY